MKGRVNKGSKVKVSGHLINGPSSITDRKTTGQTDIHSYSIPSQLKYENDFVKIHLQVFQMT